MKPDRGQQRLWLMWVPAQLAVAASVACLTVLVFFTERSLLLQQWSTTQQVAVGLRSGFHSRASAMHEFTGPDAYGLQVQPSLASQFVLYLGYHGNCSRTAIHTYRSSSLSLATAMELCQLHPNCTFFTYQREAGVTLCSGRRGTSRNNRINVAQASEQQDPHWVSGDKVGCEDFGYEEALALHHTGTMPSCFSQQAGCAFSTRSSSRCLSNMLTIRPDKSIRLGGSFLCQNPVFGLSMQSHKTPNCAWSIQLQGNTAQSAQHGLHFVTNNPGMEQHRLIPDLLKPTDNGRLASADVCLCHNLAAGLVMGAYCGNEDCLWNPSSADCVYRNRRTGTCITDLISSSSGQQGGGAVVNVCHSLQHDGIYQAYQMSTQPSDPRCMWEVVNNEFVNTGTRTSLQSILQHKEDGTLLAVKPKCLCYSSVSGLHISSTCSAELCQWTRGRMANPSDSFKEAFQYTVTQRTARYTCVLQLEPLQFTSTAQEAFQLCNSMPLCTYVAYNQHDGSTYLCQGYHGLLEVGPHRHMWLNAFKKGCDQYFATETYHDLLTRQRPSCLTERSCSTCPAGSVMVQSCSKTEEAVCDTCPNGYCGELPCHVDTSTATTVLVPPAYTHSTISVVRLLGRTYLVTGYTARGKAVGNQPLAKVVLCEYDTTRPGIAGSCRTINLGMTISNLDSVMSERTFLYGSLQAFEFKGQVFLAAMAHVRMGTGPVNAGHRYPVLLHLSPSLDKVVSAVALECSFDWMVLSEASLMMLPTWAQLYMVTSVSPLVVMLIDQTTGSCSIAQRDAGPNPFLEQTAGHRMVGTTPFVALSPDRYLGVVHRQVKYPFGPIHTHHFITLKRKAASWVVTKLSSGFRLPQAGGGSVSDSQVVSGMLLLGGADVQAPQQGSPVLLAYSVGDNGVGLGVTINPLDTTTLRLALQPAVPQQEQQRPGMVVRWETPIYESSHLAWHALNLLERLVSIRTESVLQVRDTSLDHNSRSSLSSRSKLTNYILQTNQLHNMPVDTLVRFMWPANTHKSTAKRVVQYMPWPFASFPSDWVADIKEHVHQVWVPSTFAREVLINSGIPASKVFDVAYGMSDTTCSMVTSRPLRFNTRPSFIDTQKGFLYLFSACIEWAHGIDLALKSFLETFFKEDDVALVIHNKCGDADANQYVVDMLSQAHAYEYSPEVVIISKQLDVEQQFQLCAAVDAFVLPIRADLHAQHILDAVVFGKPTIVPDKGPHMDWLRDDDAVYVRSNTAVCQGGPCKALNDGTWIVGGAPTKEGVSWLEVDAIDLALAMQHVRSKAISSSVGTSLAKRLCSEVTWAASAKKIHHLQEMI